MRYSKLFGRTSKTAPADAESINAKLLTRGGFVAKQLAGVYNFLPLGLRVLNNIQKIVREEMERAGGQEILMPALTQEENYIQTNRQGLDILFHLTTHGDQALVLNQSHEEVVTPLVKQFTFSYRDLPLMVYQIQNKFRNEPRAKSGLLRGREFNMKDAYSFHPDEAGLDAHYDAMIAVYFKIYERLGMADRTVLTYASGGSFSRYSHEFQALSDIGEDTVYLCGKCGQAVNKELIAEQSGCPNCLNVDLEERRAIEVGNIFKLKTRFTDAFQFTYADAAGKPQPVQMGCYGFGPSRLVGTLVEIFHDDRGIIWPPSVAPYQVHLAALGGDDRAFAEAERLYQELLRRGKEVLFDDRRDVSAGEKFNDADLIGLPWRWVVSKKSLLQGGVEVKRRIEPAARVVEPPMALSLLE